MRRRFVWLAIAAVAGAIGTVLAAINADPPDSRINAITGAIETVDTPWIGTNYNVRHVIYLNGGRNLLITVLSTDSRDDLGAHVVVSSVNGDSWVAWWRDATVDQVLVRRRSNATGAWTAERAQSLSSVGSRRPSVAFDGTKAWIAYETDAPGGGTVLETKVIEDDPAPFITGTRVATTSYTGAVDALIQAESGRLWLTWVDSATQVGWSRFDAATGLWSVPLFDSYAADSVAASRARIRLIVLGSSRGGPQT